MKKAAAAPLRPALGVAAFFVLSCGASIHANEGSAHGEGGSTIAYLYAEPAAGYPLVLYLDGSGCRSVTYVAAFAGPLVEHGMGVLLPEKRGVRIDDDGAHCSAEFLATNDREARIADALAVVADARLRLPRWDGRVAVVGASEGGAIAAAVALRLPSSEALAGRPNVTLQRYPSLDHQWRDRLRLSHAKDIVRSVISWLTPLLR